MELKSGHLGIIDNVLHIDNEGKMKLFGISELSIAGDILKEIKKHLEGTMYKDGKVELNSEQKVFIAKLVDSRNWGVQFSENVFELKELIK